MLRTRSANDVTIGNISVENKTVETTFVEPSKVLSVLLFPHRKLLVPASIFHSCAMGNTGVENAKEFGFAGCFSAFEGIYTVNNFAQSPMRVCIEQGRHNIVVAKGKAIEGN